MKILAASVQMQSRLSRPEENLEIGDAYIQTAVSHGAELVVLPELFCCGYGFGTPYIALAGGCNGRFVAFLQERAKRYRIGIAAGVALWHAGEIYNSIAFCLPDGRVHYYSKRNLVFWEPMVFRRGKRPTIVETPWGRIGLAICADMIYKRVWRDYQDQIDLAIISSAWPEFACNRKGRPNWLLGRLGPLCRELPQKISHDLDVPVIFSNQCGKTMTSVPLMNASLEDQFAGASAIVDHQTGTQIRAELEPALVLGEILLRNRTAKSRNTETCRSTLDLARTA
ncbi:MAG: (R)-stereoselective amidase [Planctomycetota bacterium]|jgi:N-carbamoylputrescine amidase